MQERRNCVFVGNQDYPQVNQYRANVHLITSRLIRKLMLRDSERAAGKILALVSPLKRLCCDMSL